MEKRSLRRLALVCASELTLKAFLLEPIRALASHYELTVIADSNDRDLLRKCGIPVELIPVPIARGIAPLRVCGHWLIAIFRSKDFDRWCTRFTQGGHSPWPQGLRACPRVTPHRCG